ncbi:uncharacterized protein LOC132633959 [Lycium barbarum]|uniref:uncharacterized protein LOC132633959 n=1 Tax=Lycium barbarum TaxID=112863 RepID=UPI00293E4C8B|nr:uncharacterized protein LOC132633959 [Lycium barbarum]
MIGNELRLNGCLVFAIAFWPNSERHVLLHFMGCCCICDLASKLSYSSLLGSINPMSRSRVYQAVAEEDIEADAKGNDVDLSLILINVKHITKLLGEQGREEYMVLDLKHKVICFLLERTKLCTNNT